MLNQAATDLTTDSALESELSEGLSRDDLTDLTLLRLDALTTDATIGPELLEAAAESR